MTDEANEIFSAGYTQCAIDHKIDVRMVPAYKGDGAEKVPRRRADRVAALDVDDIEYFEIPFERYHDHVNAFKRIVDGMPVDRKFNIALVNATRLDNVGDNRLLLTVERFE